MRPTTDAAIPCPKGPLADLPRSLRAWLPLLWSRALFPGCRTAEAPSSRGRVLLLLIVGGVLLYPCLGFPLLEPDEGRYAEIPREMLVRGDWVVPYLQGEPYLDKPPLFYWLVMLSYRLFGLDSWTARLVPALAVHACVLVTYLLGRRSLGEPAAFRGALLLALAPGFLGMGRLLILDGVLSLWVTLAVLAAFEAVRGPRLRRGWWLLSAVACGLGVLTKGPIAPLLLVPPLWLYRRLNGSGWRLSGGACLAFAAVVLALALPWYVLVCLRAPAFAGHFLWEHNVVRFLAPFDHIRPIWFYIPILLAGLLPGTLLAVPFLRFLLSADEATAQRRCPELGFMLLAGGWCLLFFSLSGCKLPTYILPAFPPLTLALGYFLTVTDWRRSRCPATVAVISFVLLAAGHNLVLPMLARYRSPVGRADVLVSYCGDRRTPVICYPRNCDTVAFYLGRDDLHSFRSKQIDDLRDALRQHPRTVVLFTHRHSLRGLRQFLPPDLRLVDETRFALPRIPGLPEDLVRSLTTLSGETALGLCDLAVVERCPP